MTIVEPYKKISIINILIIFSFLLLVVLSAILVFLYNKVINFEDKINIEKNEIKKIETEISETKEKLFNILSGENFKKIASENGLVLEKNPEYFKFESQQWQIGLNF